MNLTIAAVALAAAAAMGAWTGHHFTAIHYERVIAEAKVEADKAVAAANQRAENAEIDYQAWAEVQRPKTITITREVQSAVQADPDCSRKPLPDSVRDALTRAANADRPVADPAMPVASGSAAFDLGRPSDGLRGLAGRATGLLSAAPGAH